jgi:Starch-binding associating with outer membrane
MYTKTKLRFCFSLLAVSLIAGTGCRKHFEEINTNPNVPSGTERTDFLLTGGLKGLMDNTWDYWWNGQVGCQLAQYWSSNQYATESRYQFRTGITASYWNLFYAGGLNDPGYNVGGLMELQEVINKCKSAPGTYATYGDPNNQIAVATIVKVWAFQNMTDTWGEIPYTQALKGADNVAPKYDDQRTIYLGLLNELNSALALINESADATPVAGDIVYASNMTSWKKFGNSLKGRLALRMADREPELAKQAFIEANTAGMFTSNADNAIFHYLPAQPNFNPLYYNRYVENRIDYAGSNIMIDVMKNLSDGRIGIYFDPAANSGQFIGEVYGLTDAEAAASPNDSVSQRGAAILAADAPGIYMCYPEVEFMLAEAVERGFISGAAGDHYENGIRASFEYWGASGADAYVTQDSVKYSSLQAAGRSWKQIIGKQKWLALYPQGIQGWTEWRRLDFGILQLPAGPILDGTGIPLRMKYPYTEQSLNGANYQAALSAQGPDELGTAVWWDMQ